MSCLSSLLGDRSSSLSIKKVKRFSLYTVKGQVLYRPLDTILIRANKVSLRAKGSGAQKDAIKKDAIKIGDPNGTRTHVSGVRGQRPRPLDDGATLHKELG